MHYGCGLDAPVSWQNFDISPTLRIQRIPLIGKVLTKLLHDVKFPNNVMYGDIVKGLPDIQENSCSAVYCSHTLEHLCLTDFRTALINTHRILAVDGVFRCIVPDLEYAARQYTLGLDNAESNASHAFLNETMLGKSTRPRGVKAIAQQMLGNSNHLWMWDKISLTKELENAGFRNIRTAQFNDSAISAFAEVENEDRFINAVALEATK